MIEDLAATFLGAVVGCSIGSFAGYLLRPVIGGWWENRRAVKHHIVLCRTGEEYAREIARIFGEQDPTLRNTVIETEGASS